MPVSETSYVVLFQALEVKKMILVAAVVAENVLREIAIISLNASTSPSDLMACKLYESW